MHTSTATHLFGASALPPLRHAPLRHHLPAALALLRLCRASGRMVSRSACRETMSCNRVPRLVTRLVVYYFSYVVRSGASPRCMARRRPCAISPLDYSPVELAPAARPVTPSRGSATHRSVALAQLPMPCIQMCRLRHSTCCPVPLALLQPHCEPQLLVSRPQWLYVNYVMRSGGSARRAARRRLLHLTRLVVDYFAYAVRPGASACRAARRRLLRLRRSSGYLGTSRGMSSGSSCGSSSTTSLTPRVRVPRHVAQHVMWLVVDYFASRGSSCGSSSTTSSTLRSGCLMRLVVNYFASRGRRVGRRRLLRLRRASGCLVRLVVDYFASRGSSSTTLHMPRVRVPRHVARLVVWAVVDYFAYTARLSASAHRTARCAARRRLLRLTRLVVWVVVDYFAYVVRPGALCGSSSTTSPHTARRRLLHLRRASGCLGTSRGSSCGSSSTTSPTPRVRVLRHIARHVVRLLVDYFASRGLSSTTSLTLCVRVPQHVVRLVVDYFASGSSSCGSSSTSSPTPRVRVPRAACCRLLRLTWLVVDYFAYAARSGASARRAARRVSRR
jgi:hypothetical protein